MLWIRNRNFSFNKERISLYYFYIADTFKHKTIQSLISTFSVLEQQYFNSFQNKDSLKRTLFGRIILKSFATRLGIAHTEFISLTSSGKPVFTLPNGFNFNISHSGNMVVCCLTKDSFVGIDLELNKPVNIENYKSCFDMKEWQFINKSATPHLTLLKLWVRKEAIIKADGRGFAIDLSSFNCLKNKITMGSFTYFIQEIDIKQEYTCAIACTQNKTIKLTDFNEIFLEEYCNHL